MNAHDLIGLRDEDLEEGERQALAVLLAADPEARREHEEAAELGTMLAHLPEAPGGSSAAEILARARHDDASGLSVLWKWGATLVGVAAVAAVVALSMGDDGTRTKGVASAPPIRLEAVADGSKRALLHGGSLEASEGIVFRMTTPQAGVVTLKEFGPTGVAEIGSWRVEAGARWVGGETPLAWSPDDTVAGPRRYQLRWCSEEGGQTCTVDELVLHWPSR